ncbi:MAG: tetratricopeptide repeat protein [Burkholderiales bacterium]|nr:tetratricopeptide repeat protein [Burkholderiales bacterium]
MFLKTFLALVLTASTGMPAMAIDLAPLWDFNQPELSEQRFQNAMLGATTDDQLILKTQIARTHGLRRDFAKAQDILRSMEAQITKASAEVRVRHALEWGRTLASATHGATPPNAAALDGARTAYMKAYSLAKAEQLDTLAIDALHMLAFVDTAPADQLKWGQEALAVALASRQSAARKWEASLRNNIGMALHQLGRFEEALTEFKQAVVLREAAGNAQSIRVAHWMVAWTLRALQRVDEALAKQLWLERECAAAGAPDHYVYEELEHLYRIKGDTHKAEHYAQLKTTHAK